MSKKQPKSNRDISGRNDSPSKKDEVDDKNKKEKERITEYRKELSISSIHSGPLPSPEVMVGYKEVIPDGPKNFKNDREAVRA